MLHCQVAAKLLLISDAFNRNAFQRMEGEVEIEMAATIARSRAIFDEAYIRLRQTHPPLPVQLCDFQAQSTSRSTTWGLASTTTTLILWCLLAAMLLKTGKTS